MKNLKKLTRNEMISVFGGFDLEEKNCKCGCGATTNASSPEDCSKQCSCLCGRPSCGKVILDPNP